jgi:selenocysteine-specific elongation factor
MKSVIVGTAGHIDHGKTALVKALTGIDADRLEEEKRRGITIDIGFAHLELPTPHGETLRLGFVDVPGHERFVRNMLAGVGGIDLVLLVIAADDSIKPQTREHLDICRMLEVRRGIAVITKSDLVDRDTLEVVRLEVEEFLRGEFSGNSKSLSNPESGDNLQWPIIAVSSLTGAGLDELKQALVQAAIDTLARDSSALARLPIDRVFTIKGFGTVVTGTLISGTVHEGDELEVFPGEKRVRVRHVQVHGEATVHAVAGQRTALNLTGIAKDELRRGMTLAPSATFHSVTRADVLFSLLPSAKPFKNRARVHLHAYTAETVATVVLHDEKQIAPGEQAFAQLRLADATLLLPGDRFVIRQFSPVITIGGGLILNTASDAASAQRGKVKAKSATGKTAKGKAAKAETLEFLRTIYQCAPEAVLLARIARRGKLGLTMADAVAETGWTAERVKSTARSILDKGQGVRTAGPLVSSEAFREVCSQAESAVAAFQQKNPLVRGISREELRGKLGVGTEVLNAAIDRLVEEGRMEASGEQVRLPGRSVVMKVEEAESKAVIENAFALAGLKAPGLKEVLAGLKIDQARAQKIVTLLLRDKVLIKVSDELVFHRDALADLRKRMIAEKFKSAKIDVAQFKELTGVTRKYAIPLLEYLDRERVTRRVGNERVIL